MPVIDLGTVAMWYDESGQGDPFVLLHPGGAGIDSRALTPTVAGLSQTFRVYTPEQRAHGRTPDVAGPASYRFMAADTINFIETVIGRPVYLAGVSDGAVVALTIALDRPDLVRKLAFLTGVFHHDGWAAGVLDGEVPDWLRESYGELSPDGIGHYETVVGKLADMHAKEPAFTARDLGALNLPTLVMVADDDEVELEHAIEMYRSLPAAELAVVPGTSHGLMVEKPDLCNQLVTEFMAGDPVQTFAPIRRAGPATS